MANRSLRRYAQIVSGFRRSRVVVAGDLIATVSNRAVASPEDVVREIAKAKRQKAVLMLVKRAQQERFVALPIGTA